MTELGPIILYANVYRSLNGAMGSVFETQQLADQMAASGRIACVPFEVGEGLAAALRRMDGVDETWR